MNSNQELNEFENEIYPKILKYWQTLSNKPINVDSKKDRNLIKHLGLIEQDFDVLRDLKFSLINE